LTASDPHAAKKKTEIAFGIFEYSMSKRVNDCYDWPIPGKCIGKISAKKLNKRKKSFKIKEKKNKKEWFAITFFTLIFILVETNSQFPFFVHSW